MMCHIRIVATEINNLTEASAKHLLHAARPCTMACQNNKPQDKLTLAVESTASGLGQGRLLTNKWPRAAQSPQLEITLISLFGSQERSELLTHLMSGTSVNHVIAAA